MILLLGLVVMLVDASTRWNFQTKFSNLGHGEMECSVEGPKEAASCCGTSLHSAFGIIVEVCKTIVNQIEKLLNETQV